jgi:hypothetical protein
MIAAGPPTSEPDREAKTALRPTPRATIDAVMWTVGERGLKALRESANQERLARCDVAARAQINHRIERLIAAGRDAREV